MVGVLVHSWSALSRPSKATSEKPAIKGGLTLEPGVVVEVTVARVYPCGLAQSGANPVNDPACTQLGLVLCWLLSG